MSDTQFKIVVIADGESPYVDATFSMIEETVEAFERMKTSTFVNAGKHEYVFDHKDDILVLDVYDKVLHAWNRDEKRKPEDYDPSKFQYMDRVKKIIGWQIVGPDGFNIHAEDDDPFGLNSYDILVDEAVETARAWVSGNEGYKVIEVHEGDIEEPDYVARVALQPPAVRVGRPLGY